MSYDPVEVRAKLFKSFRQGNLEAIQVLLTLVCECDESNELATKSKLL